MYRLVTALCLFMPVILLAQNESVNREDLINEIKSLTVVSEVLTTTQNAQLQIIEKLENEDYNEHTDEFRYSNSANSTNDYPVIKGFSYVLLAGATVLAFPGPIMETIRNYKEYSVAKKRVLLSAFLWPVVSSVGNAEFLVHLGISCDSTFLNRALNAIPIVVLTGTSLFSAFSLVYFVKTRGYKWK